MTATTGKTGRKPAPSVAAGLLSANELAEALRAAARVAAGDPNHDFSTVIDILNTEVRDPAGQRQLYGPEANQIARALCDVIAARDRYPANPVVAVRKWTAEMRAPGAPRGAARTALVELFTAAAVWVETDSASADPDTDGIGA